MWLNLVHTVRHLRRRPVLTAAGITSLAVGIGCALACASVVNAVLFRALPYRDADRLMLVWEDNTKRGVGLTPTSLPNFRDLKAAATVFEDLGAFGDEPMTLDTPDGSERTLSYRASAGLLDLAHVPPLLGRLFTAADDASGAPDVVVLSHGMWQRRFGGDPNIVGRVIHLTGAPHTVIGVMPKGFVLPPVFSVRLIGTDAVFKEADLWVPYKLDALPPSRSQRLLLLLGRLKAGRTATEAQAEASTIAARLAAQYSVDDFGMGFAVVPLDRQVFSSVRTLLVLLLCIGALVLIIAGANAAHLLLADALAMTGETAVRSALGASSWRLASGQATLSATWCGLATAGALIVAMAIQTPVAAYARANVPRLGDTRLDGAAGLLAIMIGITLALAISLLPIAYARKHASSRSAAGTAAPVGMPRWRRLFVILQLAMAIVVMATAALLFRSASALDRINPGLVADGVSVFEFMLPEGRYATAAQRVDFERRLLASVAEVPGRQVAAVVDFVPFGGSTSVVNFTIENRAVTDETTKPRAALRAVSRAYFDALAIPGVEGRQFLFTDEDPQATVAIVNDAFVRRFADGRPIVGRRIKRGAASAPWLTVVGVVGSVKGAGLTVDAQPEVFVPYVRGGQMSTFTLVVKSSVATATLAPLINDAIHRADSALSPAAVTDMNELVSRAIGQPHFYARLFGVLAGVALLLSLGGIYGVAVLGVSARSAEIAIRTCLGAQHGDIVRMILGETALAAGIASVAGMWGAWVLQRRVAAFVYGVASTDWVVIGAAAAMLSALAIGAVYVAIRRTAVAEPMDLLRNGSGALA